MKIFKNLSQSLMVVLLASLSLTAHAQDVRGSIDDSEDSIGEFGGRGGIGIRPVNPANYCAVYQNPYQCEQVPGCQYSRIYSQCVASTGPVRPVPSYCSNYTYNQIQCQQMGCFYDLRNGACLDNGYPGPRPGPRPGPGPRPPRSFICTAEGYGYEPHFGSHQGQGRTQYEASSQALAICRSYHGDCQITSCMAQ